MVSLAIQTVHTTGINIGSIAVIVGTVIAGFVALGTWQERRNGMIRTEITGAVDHLGEVLSERLETKEKVADLAREVAELKGSLATRRGR